MNISLYQNSLLILLMSSVLIIPLIILKGFSKYSIPLFYISVIAATLCRPTILGLDNSNNFMAFQQYADFGAEAFKYSLIYHLTLFIPVTWQKFLFINLLSSSIIIYSLNKIFKQLKYKRNQKYIYLLYMSYILNIGSLLLLVHLRQYLSFALATLFLILYRSNRKIDIFFELLLSIIIFFTHPVYAYFIFFYFTCKYFSKHISYLIKNTKFITWVYILLGLLFPSYLIYQNLENVYSNITFLLPGFYTYGVQVVNSTSTGFYSLLSKIYPIILAFPLLLLKMFSINKNKNDNLQFYSIFIIYILFCIPLIVISFKANYLYNIDRVKTSIFPALFILIFHLEQQQLNKIIMLIISSSSLIMCLYTFYRTYTYLNN